jgi:alpha-tubulin suppressor-like RCC1 family protein
VIDLTEPGAATLTNNEVSNAVGIGVELLRNSGEIEMVSNTVTGTSSGEIGPLDSDTAMAYGVALFDSKSIRLENNTIANNDTAGVVADMADWGAYALRSDLSGNSSVGLQGNSLSGNGTQMPLNLVVQNLNTEAQLESDIDPEQPPARDLLPTTRSARVFRCGNGVINGAEECDPGVAVGNANCTANCRIPRGRPVDGGEGFFCATSHTGRVFCRGSNSSGQVDPTGRSGNLDLTRREDVPAGTIEIAAGGQAACALNQTGNVLCWGGGQLGRNTGSNVRQAAQNVVGPNGPIDTAHAISVGVQSGCALTGEGAVWCWGRGPLGDGTYPPSTLRTASRLTLGSHSTNSARQPVEDATQIAVGKGFGCYLDSRGMVRCWGLNNKGQLGSSARDSDMGNCGSQANPEYGINHAIDLDIFEASTLRAGDAHACVITNDGELICWGDNRFRQTRPNVQDEQLMPSAVGGVAGVTDLALSQSHTCVLIQNGEVKCWGGNSEGQLGRGTTSRLETEPARVTNTRNNALSRQLMIFSLSSASCSLSRNGALQCWGDGFEPNASMVTRLPR